MTHHDPFAQARSRATGASAGTARAVDAWGLIARFLVAAFVVAGVALATAVTARAADGPRTAAVPSDLLAEAEASPAAYFSVIVQGDGTKDSRRVAGAVVDAITAESQAAFSAANEELERARGIVKREQDRLARLERDLSRVSSRAAAEKLARLGKSSRQAHSYEAEVAALRAQIEKAKRAIAAAQASIPALEAKVAEFGADQRDERREAAARIKQEFMSLTGVAARLLGADILRLARRDGVLAITRDVPVALVPTKQSTVVSNAPDGQMWPQSTNLDRLWTTVDPQTGAMSFAPEAPAIAIIDSGIDASRAEDFGTRVVAHVNVSANADALGDGQGHGTIVAGLAAGGSTAYPGAAPNALIVDVRTGDNEGKSLTSDILRAIDWILENRAAYDIRVVNLSLAGTTEASVKYDPLDRAVEKLWFDGIVVVAAVGNHGSAGGPVGIPAPANDPFIITVGAVDQRQTADPSDDVRAPWSAYGYTADGFAKPELVAPGRYVVGPVPMDSTLAAGWPERVVAPGYMWMSGTSFAAPLVAGAAAQLLARHPEWTPDQVKGALMRTATPLPSQGLGAGIGEIDVEAAAALASPPNPNAALAPFVTSLSGELTFDVGAWETAARASTSWSSASWTSASWTSASWTSASWTSASWTSASWTSASWTSASWTSAADVE